MPILLRNPMKILHFGFLAWQVKLKLKVEKMKIEEKPKLDYKEIVKNLLALI